jgi:hypothetical protein
MESLQQIQGLVGLVLLTAGAWALSEDRRARPGLRWILGALLLQVLIALLVVRVPFVWSVIGLANHAVAAIEKATLVGSSYMFGYTGVGTMALSRFGPVTHVDASKKAVAQARANAAVAGLEDRPVRWIVDDAAKFAAREVRRGKRYDGIILDPPKFGRGPDGEVWRLEENLPALIADCARLLDAESRFLFLTVYAVRMSSLAIGGLLAEALAGLPGTVEHGELALAEEVEGGRILPTAIFARWSNPGA